MAIVTGESKLGMKTDDAATPRVEGLQVGTGQVASTSYSSPPGTETAAASILCNEDFDFGVSNLTAPTYNADESETSTVVSSTTKDGKRRYSARIRSLVRPTSPANES